MTKSLGQIVYLFKDNPSGACKKTNCHTENMAKPLKQDPAASSLPDPQDEINRLEREIARRRRERPFTVQAPSEYKKGFQQRMRAARERAGYTQAKMAALLNISQDKYAKYESRSLLPHRYVGRFCEVTDTECKFLFSSVM